MNKAIQSILFPDSVQLLGQLADAMPHVVWIAAPDGTVLYYNKNVADFSGAYQDESGRWYWENVLYDPDRQVTIDAWNEAVKTGTPYVQEHRVIMKNGTLKWHLSRGIPQKDDQGNVIRWFGTATDIDDQKKAAERIRESEERFRLLAETLPQLVWMTDQYGNQEYASSRWQEYTGIEPKDETTWRQMVHPNDLFVTGNAWRQSMTNGITYKAEVRLKNREGQYRWHAVEAEPLRNETGHIVKWIGAFSDIHDQKTNNEHLEKLVTERTHKLNELNESLAERNVQLQIANKELESFNYIASHDLQEPLRKIQTFINLLQSSSLDPETVQNYLTRINASALRMSDLIKSILDFGRLSQTNEHFEETDLNLILNEVITDLDILIEEKKAVVNSQQLPVIQAIPLQMHQLFNNLINNSLKFSVEKPTISISVSYPSAEQLPAALKNAQGRSFILLSFQDNGIGFEQQYAQKIFSLFQRLHSKHLYSGTGIGLAICKRIVENHHGYIQAKGYPDQGALFLIYLPIGY